MHRLPTYLFVANIDDALNFYERLGLQVEKVSDVFGRAHLGSDPILEFGTANLTSSYDPKHTEPPAISKGTLNFETSSKAAVDGLYRELTEAGYIGHLAPIDALWQARFAIVLDPDGNQVGLHSPRTLEDDREREKQA